MKIVLDLVTPKTTLFFHELGEALRSRQHEVIYLSRQYRESNAIQKMLRMEVKIFGRHGGAQPAGKALASSERQLALVEFFIKEQPDLVVNLSSVEASRAAYALGIPIACFNDFPEAEYTARLTIPLATTVLIPSIIPARIYEMLGAKNVFAYRAFDPLAWLQRWKIQKGRLYSELQIAPDGYRRTVVFRQEESEAAYLRGMGSKVIEAVNTLATRHPDWLFVGIPRYSPVELRENLTGANIVVPTDAVNTMALLADADIFLGGGGTMNIEAAYFGTPTVCCRPIDSVYESWLVGKGLAVKPSVLSAEAITEMAEDVVGERVDSTELREIQFPMEEILDQIEHTVDLH